MEALREIVRMLGLGGPPEDESEVPPVVLDVIPAPARVYPGPTGLWPDDAETEPRAS